MNKAKVILAQLDRKQYELIPELENAGYKTNTCELSLILNGRLSTKRTEKIAETINGILDRWQNEQTHKE